MRCMCWICWGEAYRKGIYGDWDDVICFGCGRYKISRRLLKECVGMKFDVAAMRERFKPVQDHALTPIVDRHSVVFQAHFRPQVLTGRLLGWPATELPAPWLIHQ